MKMNNILRKIDPRTFQGFLTALVCIQMFLLTLFVFLPNLITTSLTKDEQGQINYTESKYGIVVLSGNDTLTHSILRESTSEGIFDMSVIIVAAYISQIVRIILFQYLYRNVINSSFICYLLTHSWLASGKTFTNIEILNFYRLYHVTPFIRKYSEILKKRGMMANVSALIHVPMVIFCLNTFEILLFVLYHIEISINPFRITFVWQEIINEELNRKNRDNEKPPDIQDETRMETDAN
ncbi:hypothetical protein RF11_13386 [Thelohanellus kitauei]|uniref:Uncharacterized protein n=1 Tax=Thelohanellus kitauei TaxID=669202 RepID=A0A0C2M771_THEKT|nr:hypothetical protein RF11_13386 [Thelohanellus kitauei]